MMPVLPIVRVKSVEEGIAGKDKDGDCQVEPCSGPQLGGFDGPSDANTK